jgi:hypothetical protein
VLVVVGSSGVVAWPAWSVVTAASGISVGGCWATGDMVVVVVVVVVVAVHVSRIVLVILWYRLE